MTAFAEGLLSANANRRRVISTEAVGLAHRYLTRLAPDAPWRLLGVEYASLDGAIDVAWRHDDGRVMFDELKTSRIASSTLPAQWSMQARRYAAAGEQQYGGSFVGVRLLPLSQMHLARLFHQGGATPSLVPTATEPLRTRQKVA